VGGVRLHAAVQLPEVRLVQHGQDAVLQLAGALAGDDLHELDLLAYGPEDRGAYRPVDVAIAAEDTMKIDGQRLRHSDPRAAVPGDHVVHLRRRHRDPRAVRVDD